MTLEEIKDFLVDRGCEDAVVLENPDYSSAFIGYSSEGRGVYSYEKMIHFLVKEEDMSVEDAIDFIDYNTMRALPYMGPTAPIIVYGFD